MSFLSAIFLLNYNLVENCALVYLKLLQNQFTFVRFNYSIYISILFHKKKLISTGYDGYTGYDNRLNSNKRKRKTRMNGIIREKPRPNFIVGPFTTRKHPWKTSGKFEPRKHPNTTAKARTRTEETISGHPMESDAMQAVRMALKSASFTDKDRNPREPYVDSSVALYSRVAS